MMKNRSENRKPPRPETLDLYTVAETAAILNVSQKTVFEWVRNGDLPAARLGPGGRLIRIRRADLEDFVARGFDEGETAADRQIQGGDRGPREENGDE
jgi:excisionase family DNA binding protein